MTLVTSNLSRIVFAFFIIGVHCTPAIPVFYWLFPLLAIWICSVYYTRNRWGRWLITGMTLAAASAVLQAIQFQNHIHHAFATDRNTTITVEIDSYFKQNLRGVSGEATVLALDGEPLAWWQQFKLELHAGHNLYQIDEVWALSGVIKANSGQLNRQGFDKERLVYSKQIVAKFAVDDDASMQLLEWGGLRAALYSKFLIASQRLPNGGLLQAFAFGTRDSIPRKQWQKIVEHGLSHLFAISGLHIGLAFVIGSAIVWVVVPIFRLPVWLPLLFGVLTAWGLGYLSGYTLPTQRALIALTSVAVLGLLRVRLPLARAFELVLLMVLIIQPTAILSASFWLSFAAVLLMMATRSFWLKNSYLVSLVRLQICFLFGLLPLSLWIFDGLSVTGIVTNLFAVPLISFVVMPLVVVALISLMLKAVIDGFLMGDAPNLLSAMAERALTISDLGLQPLIRLIDVLPSGWWSPSSPMLWMTLIVLLVGYAYAQYGVIILWIGCLLHSSTYRPAVFEVEVFDVGHGLAMAVETPDLLLLYDTGNAWQTGSYAKSVIVPYVRQKRSQKPIWLVLSHDDADHSAGAPDLVKALDPFIVLSPSTHSSNMLCLRGTSTMIGETHFEILWPPKEVLRAYNPHSCVVRVQYAGARVLLTGDIDKRAEYAMLSEQNDVGMQAEVMSVPHHGSESSSSAKLINSVSPLWAVAGTDFNGRWDLPKAGVKQRYLDKNALWRDTGSCGAITLRGYLSHEVLVWESTTQRYNQSWYRRLIRNQSKESVAACYRQLSQ